MNHQIICFGETLWDMLPSGALPGGAPMNVAIHLTYNNYHPIMISRVGADEWGDALMEFLKNKKVSTDYIQLSQTLSTGVVQVNVNDKNDITYQIVEPVAWDAIEFNNTTAQLAGQVDVFVYGSLAARSQTSRDTMLQYLTVAKLKVFDVNLRPPHYTPARILQLLEYADIVKMNHQELELISGWLNLSGTESEQLQHILERYSLQVVVLTRGENGAAIKSQAEYIEHPGFKVEVEDTIGSGDSFLTTFLSNYLKQKPLAECLRKACLVGAYVATCKGATPTYDPALLEASFPESQQVNSGSAK